MNLRSIWKRRFRATWLGGRAATCSSLLTKSHIRLVGIAPVGVRPVHFAVCAEGSPCGRRLLRQPAGGTPARYSDIGSEPGDIGIGGGFGHERAASSQRSRRRRPYCNRVRLWLRLSADLELPAYRQRGVASGDPAHCGTIWVRSANLVHAGKTDGVRTMKWKDEI